MYYAIAAKEIMLEDRVLENSYLVIKNGRFDSYTCCPPEDAELIDYSDCILAPGLVDTHIHGYAGYDVMDNDPQGIKIIADHLLQCGVTSWLPTTLTADHQLLTDVCQTVASIVEEVEGAKIRGIFLEGPFFTEKYKGAQNPAYMSDPDFDQLTQWKVASQGLVNKIAIAPERQGVEDFIRQAKDLGVHVALGHSDATYDQAAAAVEAGASIFVHTYNGMSPLHHREPGMVGAALNLKKVYAELIADGYHVHPAACQLLLKARGSQETVLITDCMRAGGIGDGQSSLGEFDVIVKDGAARLADSGNLAGSVLELKDAVKNLVDWGIASPRQAIQMASLTAAQSVGIDDICGKIAIDREADFVVFDSDLNLRATFLDGIQRY